MAARVASTSGRFWRRIVLFGVLVFLAAALVRVSSGHSLDETIRSRSDDSFAICIVYRSEQWEVAPLRLQTLADIPRIEVSVRLRREERGWPVVSTTAWLSERESKIVTAWDGSVPDPFVAGLLTDYLRDRVAGGSFTDFAPLVRSGLQNVEDPDLSAMKVNLTASAAMSAIPILALYFAVALLLRAVLLRWARRGKCQECGYDLAGLSGSVCPECGRSFAVEKHEGV